MHIKKLGFYVSLLGSAIFGNPVVVQDFPNKPIRIFQINPSEGWLDFCRVEVSINSPAYLRKGCEASWCKTQLWTTGQWRHLPASL